MFIHILSPFLFLLFLNACTTSSDIRSETKAQLHLQLGTTHFLNSNYPLALKELLEAERLNPRDPTIQNNLGLTFMVQEKYDEAEARFKKSLQLNEKYTDARNNLGRLYLELGLYPKAIDQLEKAASDLTYEQPEKSWSNLGQAYFLAKKYEKAKQALQKSLKFRKNSCFTMNYYGRTLFELESYAAAAESLDLASQYCEKNNFEEPQFFSAMSFYKIGQVEKARARFNEIVQSFPKSLYAKQAAQMLEILK